MTMARFLLLFFWICSGALAQNIEKTVMPGLVIQGHAQYEEDCDKCHVPFKKSDQPRLCLDCHKDVGNDIKSRSHMHGHFEDTTCRSCHTDHKGRDAVITLLDKQNFNHETTGLKLKGAHRKLLKDKCESCHKPKVKYRDAPIQCEGCHRKDDVHKNALGNKCEACHGEDKWKPAGFDHDKTRYRLEGEHVYTTCKECHADAHYKDTPRDCYSCHKEDDADEDGHKGRFNRQCEKCHNTVAWEETTFDHARDTHYRLKGKHESIECKQCHSTTLYMLPKTPSSCVACHRKIDEEKGHKGSLGEKCESCHNEQEWKKSSFDHNKNTDYPLLGKHKEARCDACHTTGLKPLAGEKTRKKLPANCNACHRKIDNDKGHKGKFGEKCETCHDTYEWKTNYFDHDRSTSYALKGKHRDTKCTACHQGVLYVEKLGSECIACHRKLDNEKGHKGQLGTRCNDCHDEVKWKGVIYDHNKSRFPLTGKHPLAECKKCHLTPAFKDAKRACAACHEKEDVHKRRLGLRCEQCHNARSWKSWDFDHQKTKYPLVGAHSKVRCETCHRLPVQGKIVLSSACVDCHFGQDIHHGGFGAQCDRCHDSVSWKRILR